jgi:hypothetical protein
MVFFSLTSKPVAIFFSDLASKSEVVVFSDLASKPMARVSWFVPQNRQLQFGDLCFKIMQASVCQLRHKTDEGRTVRDTC